jgi:hypothetical protein
LKKPLTNFFPGNDDKAKPRAIGNPHRQDSNVANPETDNDLIAIEKTSGFPFYIRIIA